MPPTELSIGFDADDTLWHNQPIFERSYENFRDLLAQYHDPLKASDTLISIELQNLPLYGYGIKGFTLSAIETAIRLSDGKISAQEISQLILIARDMLAHPVELLNGVLETLMLLSKKHRLLLITKGDLRDQERKLEKSGLAGYFQHIEIVSEKNEASYRSILQKHGIPPENFMMVGNSLKSDILPALAIGASAAYIPYHVTWAGEAAEEPTESLDRLHPLSHISELPNAVRTWSRNL